MSKPTTPASRQRIAHSATSTERAAWRMAVTSSLITIGRPAAAARADPSRNPSSIASTASSSVRPFAVHSSGAIRTSA